MSRASIDSIAEIHSAGALNIPCVGFKVLLMQIEERVCTRIVVNEILKSGRNIDSWTVRC